MSDSISRVVFKLLRFRDSMLLQQDLAFADCCVSFLIVIITIDSVFET